MKHFSFSPISLFIFIMFFFSTQLVYAGLIIGPTVVNEDLSSSWAYCGSLLWMPPRGWWITPPLIIWKSGDGQPGFGVSVRFTYNTPNDGGAKYNIALIGCRVYMWIEIICCIPVPFFGIGFDNAGPYPVKVLDVTKPLVKLFVPDKLFGTTGEKLSDYIGTGENPPTIEFDIEDNNPYSFSNNFAQWSSDNGYSKKWKVILWYSSFYDDHDGIKKFVFFELPLIPSTTKDGTAPSDFSSVVASAKAHFIVPLDELKFVKRDNIPLPVIPLNYANSHSKYNDFGNYQLSMEVHDSSGNMDFQGPFCDVIVADNDPPNIYVGIGDKQGTIGSWVKKVISSLPFVDPEKTEKVWLPMDIDKKYSKSPYLYDWKANGKPSWTVPVTDAPQPPDTILFNGFNHDFTLDWYIRGGDGSNNEKKPIRTDSINGTTYRLGAVSEPSHEDSKIFDRLPTLNDSKFGLVRELIQEDVEIVFDVRLVDNIDGIDGQFIYKIDIFRFMSNTLSKCINTIAQTIAGPFSNLVFRTVFKEPTKKVNDKYYLKIISEDNAKNWSGAIKRNKRILQIDFMVQEQGIMIEEIKKSNRDY